MSDESDRLMLTAVVTDYTGADESNDQDPHCFFQRHELRRPEVQHLRIISVRALVEQMHDAHDIEYVFAVNIGRKARDHKLCDTGLNGRMWRVLPP